MRRLWGAQYGIFESKEHMEEEIKKKIGLALGGGGARGFAHLGAIARLLELGVPMHCVSGTSIGAIVGAIMAAGTLDRAFAWCREPDWKKIPRLFLETGFTGKGLIKGDQIAKILRDLISVRTFEELPMPFAAVAADLHTGERVVMRTGDLISAVRASMSIPGVFSPVEREGRVLVDGGLLDPLPVAACRSLGADIVIAIDINPPESTSSRKPFAKLNIFDVMFGTFRIFNREMTRRVLSSDGAPDVLVSPAVGDVLALDFRHSDRVIQLGRDAVDACIDQLSGLIKR